MCAFMEVEKKRCDGGQLERLRRQEQEQNKQENSEERRGETREKGPRKHGKRGHNLARVDEIVKFFDLGLLRAHKTNVEHDLLWSCRTRQQ